jgi:hypothetical protein
MNMVLHSPLLGYVVFSFLHNEKFFVCTKKESFSFGESNHNHLTIKKKAIHNLTPKVDVFLQ